jgi:hypothetical protein
MFVIKTRAPVLFRLWPLPGRISGVRASRSDFPMDLSADGRMLLRACVIGVRGRAAVLRLAVPGIARAEGELREFRARVCKDLVSDRGGAAATGGAARNPPPRDVGSDLGGGSGSKTDLELETWRRTAPLSLSTYVAHRFPAWLRAGTCGATIDSDAAPNRRDRGAPEARTVRPRRLPLFNRSRR